MFVNCEVTNQIWVKVIKWLDLPFTFFGNILELMRRVDSITLRPVKRKVLEVIVVTTIWLFGSTVAILFSRHIA